MTTTTENKAAKPTKTEKGVTTYRIAEAAE